MGASLTLVLIGAAIGLAAALTISRLIASQLFNVSPADPATYFTVAGATIATALLATWHPAWRAARVDPVKTLWAE
jgi:ABC-type lipoprotein release transport system permease subunit